MSYSRAVTFNGNSGIPIGRLALHTARLPEFCTRFLTTEELDLDKEKFPDFAFESTAHLLSELDRTAGEAKSHLAASSDDDLRRIGNSYSKDTLQYTDRAWSSIARCS